MECRASQMGKRSGEWRSSQLEGRLAPDERRPGACEPCHFGSFERVERFTHRRFGRLDRPVDRDLVLHFRIPALTQSRTLLAHVLCTVMVVRAVNIIQQGTRSRACNLLPLGRICSLPRFVPVLLSALAEFFADPTKPHIVLCTQRFALLYL